MDGSIDTSILVGAAVTLGGWILLMLTTERRPSTSLAYSVLMKAIPSIGFLVVAAAIDFEGANWTQWVAIGLVLSALGDVLLVGAGTGPFVAGLGAFLLGHVAYAVAFVSRGVSWVWGAGALIVVGAVAFAFARWLLPKVTDSLVRPVVAYIIVITFMVATAAGSVGHAG
ncbi:MAG TPA: hypothetical protein DCQ06_13070, partial [Myxococcales bacterium]|nr:hypothetical protein [Myxococcales bacterium]